MHVSPKTWTPTRVCHTRHHTRRGEGRARPLRDQLPVKIPQPGRCKARPLAERKRGEAKDLTCLPGRWVSPSCAPPALDLPSRPFNPTLSREQNSLQSCPRTAFYALSREQNCLLRPRTDKKRELKARFLRTCVSSMSRNIQPAAALPCTRK